MHFTNTLILLGVLGAAVAGPHAQHQPRCKADNCLRAVRASSFPKRPGTADCSSYFRTTITPAANTLTVTATATVSAAAVARRKGSAMRARDAAPEAALEARQVTVAPSSIPTYASACSGSARYSSACSCIGVTAQTIIVSATASTVTATVTVTGSPFPQPTLAITPTGDLCPGPSLNGIGDGVLVQGQCRGTQGATYFYLHDYSPSNTCTGSEPALTCRLYLYNDNSCQDLFDNFTATPGTCTYVGTNRSVKLVCSNC